MRWPSRPCAVAASHQSSCFGVGHPQTALRSKTARTAGSCVAGFCVQKRSPRPDGTAGAFNSSKFLNRRPRRCRRPFLMLVAGKRSASCPRRQGARGSRRSPVAWMTPPTIVIVMGIAASIDLTRGWRPRPESNRCARICSPLRNHSATWPICGEKPPN
jgi:hypothetical protein